MPTPKGAWTVASLLFLVATQVKAGLPPYLVIGCSGLLGDEVKTFITLMGLVGVKIGIAGATALMPVYAATILHVGPTGLGYLRSAPAVGAAIVAAVLSRRPPRTHVGPLAFISVIGFGVATIAFAVSLPGVLLSTVAPKDGPAR